MDKEKILNIIKKCSTFDVNGNVKYVDALEYDMLANKLLEAINYTRCSTQLKLVYTSDFCKWLETGFTYYDKTSDFINKTGYRMTFKELVNKYEQEQNKKALIV